MSSKKIKKDFENYEKLNSMLNFHSEIRTKNKLELYNKNKLILDNLDMIKQKYKKEIEILKQKDDLYIKKHKQNTSDDDFNKEIQNLNV